MRLIITDVTEMGASKYCVAGWNARAQRMVRPLPNGANWTAGLRQRHGIVPGASVDVTPTGQRHRSLFPHHTEDTPVSPATIRHVNSGPIDWFAAGAPPTYRTVSEAFSGHIAQNSIWNNVRQAVYVPVGTQVGSLAAVRCPRASVQFIETFNKLRAVLNDGDSRYELAISSLALKTAWRQGGLAAVRRSLPATPQFHIRLGLARAFGNSPDKCYLMVNGIHG